MSNSKKVAIQHFVNPALLPSHEVHFASDLGNFHFVGQVLFYSCQGGLRHDDQRVFDFVGVYDPDEGHLIALLNMKLVLAILPLADAEAV